MCISYFVNVKYLNYLNFKIEPKKVKIRKESTYNLSISYFNDILSYTRSFTDFSAFFAKYKIFRTKRSKSQINNN